MIFLGIDTSCYTTSIAAVDENGNVIDGDLILYVCGKYLKEIGQLKDDMIVTTVMSNIGLYKACDKVGLHYQQTKVGDKYVFENIVWAVSSLAILFSANMRLQVTVS